jgi:hypothetical protein
MKTDINNLTVKSEEIVKQIYIDSVSVIQKGRDAKVKLRRAQGECLGTESR